MAIDQPVLHLLHVEDMMAVIETEIVKDIDRQVMTAVAEVRVEVQLGSAGVPAAVEAHEEIVHHTTEARQVEKSFWKG